ncbi:type III-B CRISPR-associated protein Cas10/Cmr2 [Conchiformibius kuhniae]|uniref:Type III-B CRISPR-associated protein Cas10/Cmr2 n=1 Tax=Conchiformibius kuhniae TaxID=211502 RepID=A0A8T9MTJ4_9NEIS|nr:type III-B CRISPR-associated protein Cas10/Cmr2 [Conchiformibius kuhniae]
MNQYILILSVGPVQGFIAAARRSRDLWCGSWLLSEIAKAAAKHLQDAGAEMIFPSVSHDAGCLNEGSDFSVGNKIQVRCECADGDAVTALGNAAAAAAKRRFRNLAADALKKLGKDADKLRSELWAQQLDDYVEVQFAWARENGDYREACQKAARLLVGRKATRDFAPAFARSADDERYMLPKSSLDGARETVLLKEKQTTLPKEKQISRSLRQKLGLKFSEQLDCAGVVKRMGGDSEQFTPITRVAADSWLRELPKDVLKTLREAYEPLVANGLATRVRGNQGVYQDFPYDGQFLYRSRLDAAIANAKKGEKSSDDAAEKQDFASERADLQSFEKTVKTVWETHGEPCPYWVMLLADGDRMGALLDKAETMAQHQEITEKLSEFAGSVPETLREHHGHCIYAGGDDVLGLLSLRDAVKCAEVLKDAFAEKLAGVAENLGVAADKSPSLSVGLAICHIQTPLGNVRALAKRAEKTAKGDDCAENVQRNALGITLAVRSGSTLDWRARWDDQDASLDAITRWVEDYGKGILSSRIAYDCRQIFIHTDFPMLSDSPPSDADLKKNNEDLKKIRAAEFKRMLEKARSPNGGELDAGLKERLLQRFEQVNDLQKMATELIVARWLSAKTQRDLAWKGDE